jgi:hypothetical protein
MSKSESKSVQGELKAPPAPLTGGAIPLGDSGAESVGHKTAQLPQGYREFLWHVHSYTNEYIRFSDAKSGVALAFAITALGSLHATGLVSNLLDVPRSDWGLPAWLTLLAAVLLVLGALSAAWSIRPRLQNAQPEGFIYWEGVRAHASGTDFHRAFARQSDADLDQHLAEHVHVLSRIASRKYYWSAWAVLLTMAGASLGGMLVVLA